MPKKLVAVIKLALPAGKATPAPPVGPALGQHGLNIAAFCKDYNAQTGDKGDLIIPVEISAYEDRTYSFILKTPPASVLLADAAKIKKGSATPNRVNVGSITKSQLEEIANIKGSYTGQFLKPLYEALYKKNPDEARRIYKKARENYHSVSKQTLDEIIL